MNQFNALCKLASADRWCWNLHCATCGHLHFRYAFLELESGKAIIDGDWIVRRRKTSYVNQLGPLPRSYSESQKGKVLTICSGADIQLIAKECKFPDWLGYLGLVLAHMQSDSDVYKLLSRKWASQLQGFVSKDSSIWHRLEAIVKQQSLLGLEGLEGVESDMTPKN